MVVVRILGRFLVEVDPACNQEGVSGLDNSSPDGCLWVKVSFHSSFGDFEGNLVAVESLLRIVGSRDTIAVPYRNGRWS